MLRSVVPAQIVSNGEYLPLPQTRQPRRVEARLLEIAATASRRLGMPSRQLLTTTGRIAASLLAMNEVFGRFFTVDPVGVYVPAAFAVDGLPEDVFVFDDQLHFICSNSPPVPIFERIRATVQGPSSGYPSTPFNPDGQVDELGSPWTPWNPALVGLPSGPECFQLVQLAVGLLTNVTAGVLGVANAPPEPRNVEEAMQGKALPATAAT